MSKHRNSTQHFACPVPLPRGIHYADGRLQNRPIVVHLAGCGGTGSQILTGLARIHLGLIALGHPYGLDVRAFDPDTVSPSNVGRQLFSPADVGAGKAATLVTRLNCFFGLSWMAYTDRYEGTQGGSADFLITCVDTAVARRHIAERVVGTHNPPYILDCGNSRKKGQVFLTQVQPGRGPTPYYTGQMNPAEFVKGGLPVHCDLPTLWETLPELFDADIPEDDTPSCSLAEALGQQDLFINQTVATMAEQLLWTLLREGKISHHGFWINLEEGRIVPVPVPNPHFCGAGGPSGEKAGTNG